MMSSLLKISRFVVFAYGFAAFCTAGLCAGYAAQAYAAKGDLPVFYEMKDDKLQAPLRLTLGKADLVDVGGNVTDVLVANPGIIDVMAVQAGRLYVVGLDIGDTNIIALDDKGNVIKRMDVHVSYDLQAMQSLLSDVFPSEDVKLSSIHDRILLTGSVSNPETSSRVADLVAQYVGDLQNQDGTVDELISNLLQVRGEQQVMLQVRIVEVSRNLSRDLGLQLTSTGGAGDTITRFAPGAAIGLDETAGSINFITETGISNIGQLNFQLDALEEDGLANVLAEPNLTAVSGEQAGFLAGGEFPVPRGLDRQGNLVVEFKDFGVSLNFRPVVLSKDRISLQMETEVSSLDFENAVNLGTVDVPGLDVRRAETTVELPSGGVMMIAGLLQSESLSNMAGLPGINKAPILGRLLSSEGFQRNETELVVIVSPYLVRSFDDDSTADEDKNANAIDRIRRPLAAMFARNISKVFELADDGRVFDGSAHFGYIVD